ncbi:STAS domain-containing protein [Streptomyces sp. NPDC003480]
MNDLTLTTQQHPDGTVITVAGEIDLNTCSALARAALNVPLGGKTLRLEMSGVSFMDSTGLNLLLQLRGRLHAEGGRLVLTGLQDQAARLLHLTGTYDLLVSDTSSAADASSAVSG